MYFKILIAFFFILISYGFSADDIGNMDAEMREWAIILGYSLLGLFLLIRVLRKYENAKYFFLILSLLLFAIFTLILIYFHFDKMFNYIGAVNGSYEKTALDDTKASMTLALDLNWLFAVYIYLFARIDKSGN